MLVRHLPWDSATKRHLRDDPVDSPEWTAAADAVDLLRRYWWVTVARKGHEHTDPHPWSPHARAEAARRAVKDAAVEVARVKALRRAEEQRRADDLAERFAAQQPEEG